jgi:hypothetical protein
LPVLSQVCGRIPQLPHGRLRSSPGWQAHSVGASQAVHSPIAQCSKPEAQALEQSRTAVVVTIGSSSLQSLPAAIPSSSLSASGMTHLP